MRLPPHNQRRLNVKIKEVYGNQYADWYELAHSMQFEGATYEQIKERFAILGIRVSLFTIHDWLKKHESMDTVQAEGAG